MMVIGAISLLAMTFAGPSTGTRQATARTVTPPNIVFIITDDMRADQLWAMPVVNSELVAHGTSFSNAFVPNPWCCPSRASILTGTYSHTNGVYRNAPPYGGWASFKPASTIATWLHGGGYRTGLIGKYFNGYKGTTIPPGWDEWAAFSGGEANEGGAYYDYDFSDDGVLTHRGSAPEDYSTSLLAGKADAFIRGTPAGQPLFLYFTPFAPHLAAIPEDKYATAFTSLRFTPRPPSFNEADISDKPAYIRSHPLMTSTQIAAVDSARRKMLRTLLSVDDAVQGILTALQDTGRLANTMIVFTSDNGFLRGEHRWTKKIVPYEESIHIPLVVRYDPLTTAPTTDSHLVLNVDWAPTAAALAGVAAPGAEGTSMVSLLNGAPAPVWRSEFVVEHMKGGSSDTVPSYCGVRTKTYKYVAYSTHEEELYDLVSDPSETKNLAKRTAYATLVAELRARAMVLCSPTPPGFTW